MIRKGEINLTQLNQAKSFFNEMGLKDSAEKKKVINEIKGKTTKETEVILHNKKGNNLQQSVNISFKKETYEKLLKLKALKAHSYPNFDSLILKMMDVVTEAWDPGIIRRHRKKGTGVSRYVQASVRAEVWQKSNGKCVNCGSVYALQIDHVHAYSKGGKTLPQNLQLLCRNCNQRKGNTMIKQIRLS